MNDPFDELPQPDRVALVTDTALEQSPGHLAAKKARAEELGTKLTPGERDDWMNLHKFVPLDDLMKYKEPHVREFMDAVNKVGNQPGGIGRIADLSVAGKAKRGWYKDFVKSLFHLMPTADDGYRLAGLIAATSPLTGPSENIQFALDLYKEWNDAKRPGSKDNPMKPKDLQAWVGGVYDKWLDNHKKVDLGEYGTVPSKMTLNAGQGIPTIASVLGYQDVDWTKIKLGKHGPKINPFFQNMIGNGNEVVLDTWEARRLGVKVGDLSKPPTKKSGLNERPTHAALASIYHHAANTLNQSLSPGEAPWTASEIQETGWTAFRVLAHAQAIKKGEVRGKTPEEALYTMTHGDVFHATDFVQELCTNKDVEKRLRYLGLGEKLDTLRKVYARYILQKAPAFGERAVQSLHPPLEHVSRATSQYAKTFEGPLAKKLSAFCVSQELQKLLET